MDGKCKQPYTIRGTGRFASSRSQGSEAEQTNRGHLEAVAGQAGACNGWPPNLRRKTSPHPNPEKYPHESIAFVVVDEDIFLVPWDVAGDVIHLRTIIPSREATRQYLQEKRSRP